MVQVFDPLKARQALDEAREATGPASAAEVAGVKRKAPRKGSKALSVAQPSVQTPEDQEAILKADFRQFLILLWNFLLHCDPSPTMLDLAWYLQHGPERSAIEAFRGFSKSWITGAYGLWRLYCDPQEKVLMVSGSLAKALANTNWMLMVINSWPLLHHLIPQPHQRQAAKAFDVGPATPEQSPSVHALGIGGQMVGFRASVIIPDDVETQTNSITVAARDKNLEAVKEFDSVIKPDPRDAQGNLIGSKSVIKFLGTPHDEDSLYNHLPDKGYEIRLWPALFPTQDQVKRYGSKLAPWVTQQIRKLGPGCVGTPIMPTRFTMEDLDRRKKSIGASEFALQFMLDTSLSDRDKYPLKVRDLMVMALDPRKGPESVAWTNELRQRQNDLPVTGFEGDFYYEAALPPGVAYVPYNRIIGSLDTSGRGKDEVALTILAELNGVIYLLHLWAAIAGYEPATLKAIADACVRFRVQKLKVEVNFGDGMIIPLLRPVLEEAWKKANLLAKKAGKPISEQDGGTSIEEVRVTNQMAKERRMLAILEPVSQQHRLVVARSVVEYDYDSILKMEGEDGRHRYGLFHQFTHLTRDKDSLDHDDRVDALSTGVLDFADILGVDPSMMAKTSSADRDEEEYLKLFGDLEEDDGGILKAKESKRARSLLPSPR